MFGHSNKTKDLYIQYISMGTKYQSIKKKNVLGFFFQ